MPRWRARGGSTGWGWRRSSAPGSPSGSRATSSSRRCSSTAAGTHWPGGISQSAAQSARNASAIQPWSSEAQLQLALAEKANGDLAAATAAVREAVDRASHDWRPWLVAAEVAAAAGNRQGAEFGLAVANKLSPRPLPVKLAPQR